MSCDNEIQLSILVNNIGPIGIATYVNLSFIFQPDNVNEGPAPEIHDFYEPFASATNVINYSGQSASHNSPGNNAASCDVPLSVINEPDNKNGSSTVTTPYDSQPIVVGTTVVNCPSGISITIPSVMGRFDKSTVIRNPA